MFQAAVYLAALVSAIAWCYSQRVAPHRLIISLVCVLITWFYILRFTALYEGDNVFDAAYEDVIWGGRQGNWALSQALFTWAIVAMVWSNESCAAYQVFGVFGAMSASFAVYPQVARPAPKIPWAYAACAALGFVFTWRLPVSQSTRELVWWLWGLHAALLVPKAVPRWLGPQLDACQLYLLLAAGCAGSHWVGGLSPVPSTDCRISISVDLAACTMITLAFVRKLGADSAAAMAVAAAGALLLSPGAVLAVSCAAQHGAARRVVTALQRAVAVRSGGGGRWYNLGLWAEAGCDYPAACEALARALGQAAGLASGERVLCVGCGTGAELQFLRQEFSLLSAVGLDPSAGPRVELGEQSGVRVVAGLAEDAASFQRSGFRPGDFDHILAVDSIYHFDKSVFFGEVCSKLLPREGGSVSVTDLVVSDEAPLWVRAVLVLMGVKAASQWSRSEYTEKLKSFGLRVRCLESLEPHVLGKWFPAVLCRHLDYVCVSATRAHPAPPRPTVAVVGSGMSGLLAARLLSETHDVTVLEASSRVNLAGEAVTVGGQSVDSPLRMLGVGYTQMTELLAELGVRTTPCRFDSAFYRAGDGRALYKSELSKLSTLWGRRAQMWTLLRLAVAAWLRRPKEGMSFGQWAAAVAIKDTDVYRVFVLPQLGWMLSCDAAMVERYPAGPIVDVIRSVNAVTAFTMGVRRIVPNNKAAQDALTEGLQIKLGVRVGPIPEDKVIDGERYDAVVVATEATAVPQIMGGRQWASVFADFPYHPSSVLVHRDAALMPADRSEWRMINVRIDPQQPAVQLTVWLNAYYGGAKDGKLQHMDVDGGDLFETWNAHQPPREGTLLKESYFSRVVHDAKTAQRLHQAVAELQGRDGFYFVGAYAAPGLGLLEQAVRSTKGVVATLQGNAVAASQLLRNAASAGA